MPSAGARPPRRLIQYGEYAIRIVWLSLCWEFNTAWECCAIADCQLLKSGYADHRSRVFHTKYYKSWTERMKCKAKCECVFFVSAKIRKQKWKKRRKTNRGNDLSLFCNGFEVLWSGQNLKKHGAQLLYLPYALKRIGGRAMTTFILFLTKNHSFFSKFFDR